MIFISGSLKELQETFKNTKENDERGGGGLENYINYNTYQPCQVLSNLPFQI